MQRLTYFAASLLLLLLGACTKEKTAPGTASLTIINAIPGSRSLITNFNDGRPINYYLANEIRYNTFLLSNRISSYSGRTPLALYHYPDTTDKSKPMFNLVVDLPIGSMHTLFLAGTLTQPDTLFVRDVIPYHPLGDSSCGFRFVNLSPGSAPVKVTIARKNGPPVVSTLPFKRVTGFLNYPVNAAQEDMAFEFRDVATDRLIATFPVEGIHNPVPGTNSPWAYKNYTLALVGLPDGTNGQEQTILSISY
ncbi:hypothetical protein SAMN04488128_104384 [Chitinophaga eiseniae]|uniref:DUF4397 domain-containing protein n=1 Tax=Chitinophaga eiseniae TaxID=634771 RepID=A0A1T4TCX0_9BACT|nr:DUF4397 domain-containing protein [Chitinophaga eiseniae]SKA38059.1 hypothetical protein SAMN04488128_104384 [Chitinophaga eiseniae]